MTPEEAAAKLEVCRQLHQYVFQRKYLQKGQRILNIGCDIDCGLLKYDFQAINIDINQWSGANDCPTQADIIHDARLPFPFNATADVAVLGDILEHFSDEDAKTIITNTRNVLKPGGILIITCPEDNRSLDAQNESAEHVSGVSKAHERPITIEIINSWLKATNMLMLDAERITYGIYLGWGVRALSLGKP
jgi:SAM-dependent methyltransferase